MEYTCRYSSPLGGITLASDGDYLTGLWFDGQKYFAATLSEENEEKALPVLEETKRWLDLYFQGKNPDFTPPLRPKGSPFRQAVWKILREIPYGRVITYGEIARRIVQTEDGQPPRRVMSGQAVGGAVAHNPISLIIPCHRVVGSSGSLTGYAGGMEKKIYLLTLEKVDRTSLFVPQKGTAL